MTIGLPHQLRTIIFRSVGNVEVSIKGFDYLLQSKPYCPLCNRSVARNMNDFDGFTAVTACKTTHHSHFTLSVSPSSSPVAAWTTSRPPGECTRISTWVSRFPPNSVTKRLSKLVPVLNMRSPDSHATESESDTEDGTIRWRQEQKTILVTRTHTFFIKRRVWLLLMKKF